MPGLLYGIKKERLSWRSRPSVRPFMGDNNDELTVGRVFVEFYVAVLYKNCLASVGFLEKHFGDSCTVHKGVNNFEVLFPHFFKGLERFCIAELRLSWQSIQ
jgi:hypothetical protein